MAADGSRFVAGAYIMTGTGGAFGSNTVNIGSTIQGFRIAPSFHTQPIHIDELGDTVADGVYRGYNLRLSCVLAQWTGAGRAAIQFPYDMSGAGGTNGTISGIGQTIGGIFGMNITLTPIPGINSNSVPWNFPVCAPDGESGAFNLNSMNRETTINLLVLPKNTVAGSGTNIATTSELFTGN